MSATELFAEAVSVQATCRSSAGGCCQEDEYTLVGLQLAGTPDSDHPPLGPRGLWEERESQGGWRVVDHPAQAGQAGGEDHIMERNLDNPLISLRGLAADHCMSRLLLLQFLWLTKIRTIKTWCSP